MHIWDILLSVYFPTVGRRLCDKKQRFTDESSFARTGLTDIRKEHVWSDQNPHGLRSHHLQRNLSFNLWTKILGEEFTFWHITPCGPLEVNWHFRRTCCLHLPGRRTGQARNQPEADSKQSNQFRVKVALRPTISQSVRLGVDPIWG
jgi:hypothetical protein